MGTKVDAVVALGYDKRISEIGGVLNWHGYSPAYTDEQIANKLIELEALEVIEKEKKERIKSSKKLLESDIDINSILDVDIENIDEWVDTNFKTLNELKTHTAHLTKLVSILYHEHLLT